MLVKIDKGSALNMLNVDSVLVREETIKTYHKVPFLSFSEPRLREEYKKYSVEIVYRNMDGKVSKFTLDCGRDGVAALRVSNEILGQVKELEGVGATQELERALKNG